VLQRPTHHFSRVDARPVYRTPEQDLERQWPVLGIQKQAAEHLAHLMPEHGFQIASHCRRAVHCRFSLNGRGKVPAPNLQQCLQLAVPHRPQAEFANKGVPLGFQQLPQATELHQQPSRQLNDIAPAHARAEKYGKQFRIGQAPGPTLQQLLSRPLF
jgi:hypothetical protein